RGWRKLGVGNQGSGIRVLGRHCSQSWGKRPQIGSKREARPGRHKQNRRSTTSISNRSKSVNHEPAKVFHNKRFAEPVRPRGFVSQAFLVCASASAHAALPN